MISVLLQKYGKVFYATKIFCDILMCRTHVASKFVCVILFYINFFYINKLLWM
jgi:hypothetical protein